MEQGEGQGLPAREFDALLQGAVGAAPLLRSLIGGGDASTDPRCARREALLSALRPYLSPARQEAADYLLRLWRWGSLLRAGGRKGED
jgi:hypothetical protein